MATELNPNVPNPVQKVNGVTTRTITPTVFLTGQYQISGEAKAAELTRLMQQLLAFGVFPNVIDAAQKGIPAGTYVVVDDPKTPVEEFSVQVVPRIFKKGPKPDTNLAEPRV
jgi:hypothetical protein